MVDRLKLYIEHCGMIASQFADAIGMPRSSFSQLMSGRNKTITDATISKIHATYPELSISWLLFGEGSMIVAPPTHHATVSASQPQLTFFDENEIFEPTPEPTSKYEQEIEAKSNVSAPAEADKTPIGSIINVVEVAKQHSKKIVKIMVFYDDNSYESFKPE